MSKLLAVIGKEIREALPATIFFLILFHLIGLTKAVALDDYSVTALRTAGATVGALIVAKAILLVEALPLSRIFTSTLIHTVLWKTFLYGVVVLLFRFIEELIPLFAKHDSLAIALQAMSNEVAWPLFAVLTIWTFAGLFLYSLVAELVQAAGRNKVRQLLFGART